MAKFVIRSNEPAARALADAVESLSSLLREEELNLNTLGERLHLIVVAARGVFTAQNLPSVRMDAAVKALDLRTGKSELAAFARPPT